MSVCPCTLTTPCRESCTCADEFKSGGCDRCATYGSKEQQLAAAVRIAAQSEHLRGRVPVRLVGPDFEPVDAFLTDRENEWIERLFELKQAAEATIRVHEHTIRSVSAQQDEAVERERVLKLDLGQAAQLAYDCMIQVHNDTCLGRFDNCDKFECAAAREIIERLTRKSQS